MVNFDLESNLRTESAEVRTCPLKSFGFPSGFFQCDDANEYESLIKKFEELSTQDGSPWINKKVASFGSVDQNFVIKEDCAQSIGSSLQTTEVNQFN